MAQDSKDIRPGHWTRTKRVGKAIPFLTFALLSYQSCGNPVRVRGLEEDGPRVWGEGRVEQEDKGRELTLSGQIRSTQGHLLIGVP